jgi:transcriptional repressor NrdR
MRCPECGFDSSRVIDSRPSEEGVSIRRRRECESCAFRFTTYERTEAVRRVRKRSGRLEPFDSAKLSAGLRSALAERPVPENAIDDLVTRVEAVVFAGAGPIESSTIGALVLEGLKELDTVAYLRFASVYEDFEGAEDFEQALAGLGETIDLAD